MSAGVRLGVLEGVAVAVRGLAAGTVGRAVKVRVGLGVGLAAVGETSERAGGVGLIQQPARVLEIMTSNRNRANRRILASNPGLCEPCLSWSLDGRDVILIILSS